MLGITNIFGFMVASAAVIFIPGPATFYVIAKSNHGLARAVASVLGIIAGDLVLISLAGFGFASIAHNLPVVLHIMKYVGAIYIAYLGVTLFLSEAVDDPETLDVGNSRGDFGRGLLLTLTNPKPILFFVAFFPLFIVPSDTPYIATFYALGGLFQLINLVYFSAIIGATIWLSTLPMVKRFMQGGFNKIAGAILVLMAVLLVSNFI